MPWSAKIPDIGEGLANGIAGAGQILGGAISDIAKQKQQTQNADDTIEYLHGLGGIKDEEYAGLIGKGTPMKEKFIGQFMSRYFGENQVQNAYDKKIAEGLAQRDLDTKFGPKNQANLDEVSLNADKYGKYNDDEVLAEAERRGLLKRKPAPVAQPALTLDRTNNPPPGMNFNLSGKV
jgi:hypothetical protein